MRTLSRGVALAMVAAASVTGMAQAQSRQNAGLGFTTATPGASTGLSLSIDYFDPARPGSKPYAVQTVVQQLAAGARFDTSVPAACTASDAQLIAQGPSACPSGSIVGTGSIVLDTGAAVMREIPNKLTFLNAPGQLLLLTETTNQPGGARTVTHGQVREGRSVRTDVPPVPGTPPPDSFTAIKTVRGDIKPVSRGARRYITTPTTCPSVGHWTNRTIFTYRDGVTQPTNTSAPCTPRRLALELRLTGRRSHRRGRRPCFVRRVRATVAGADRGLATSARFTGGRLDTRSPLSRIVDARRHRGRSHRHVARARVRLSSGQVVHLRRVYRVCGLG